MKASKTLELLNNIKNSKIDFGYLDDAIEAIKELKIKSRYISELENDAVSLQKEYSDKCRELKDLENRSCESCSNFNPNIKSLKYAVCAKIGNTTVPHSFCCNRWESK